MAVEGGGGYTQTLGHLGHGDLGILQHGLGRSENFANIASRRQQEAICNLARTLASLDQHEALAPAEPGMAMVGEYTAGS